MNKVDKMLLDASVASIRDVFTQLKEAVMNRDLIALSVCTQRLQEELLAQERIVKRLDGAE